MELLTLSNGIMTKKIGIISLIAFLVFAFLLTIPSVAIAAQKSFKELLQQSKKYYANGEYELFFKDFEINTYSQYAQDYFFAKELFEKVKRYEAEENWEKFYEFTDDYLWRARKKLKAIIEDENDSLLGVESELLLYKIIDLEDSAEAEPLLKSFIESLHSFLEQTGDIETVLDITDSLVILGNNQIVNNLHKKIIVYVEKNETDKSVQLLKQAAEQYFIEQEYEHSKIYYRAWISLSKNNSDIDKDVLYVLEKFLSYIKYLKMNPQKVEGTAYVYNLTAEIAEEAVKVSTDEKVTLNAGICFKEAGWLQEAERLFLSLQNSSVEEIRKKAVKELVETYYIYGRGNKYDSIESLLGVVNQESFLEIYFMLGKTAFEKRDFVAAKLHFQKIVAEQKESSDAYMARLYLKAIERVTGDAN